MGFGQTLAVVPAPPRSVVAVQLLPVFIVFPHTF